MNSPSFLQRRQLLALASAALASGVSFAQRVLPPVDVYKNPSCGCCGAWVDHLRAAGFTVAVHEVADTAVARRRHGIPEALASCHTAMVGGYAIEGHVPAADVKRLLAQRPAAVGLSVPGMPMGSPGMEAGPHRDAFDVLLVDKSGRSSVFARYPAHPEKKA